MKTPKWIVLAALAAALAPAARATTPVAYTISYDLDGGTLPSDHPTTYTSESAVTLVNPTRTGYDFAGWTWPEQGAGGDNDTPDADLAFVVLSPGPKQGCTSTVKFYANNEAAALARVPNVYVHWGATDAGGNTAWTDVPGDPMTWVDADGAWEAQIAVPADAVSLSFLFNDGTTWLHYNDVRGGDQTEWMCEVAAGSAEPNTPQTSVTIPAGSTGDKFFTAHWTPTPWQALQAQLDAGGVVTLASDVTAETNDVSLVVTNAVTLDLNGCLINADGLFGAIRVAAGGDLTLTNGAGGAVAGGNAEYGGGVYVDAGGAFTMAGGWIAFGSAKSGGGVYVAGGTFKMTGGTIANNMAEESGGGVRVAGGAFEMTGGTISGNTAARYGGGVCVDGGGSMRMSGGTISGNTGTGAGGGVYLRENGAFAVSGAPVVFGNYGGPNDDNVHLEHGTAVVVDGLSAGASIGVTADEVPTSSAPVVVATGAAAGDEARFSSDNPAFGVGAENGEVRLLRQTTPWERLQALLDAGGANGVVTLTNDVAATSVDSTLVVTNAVTLDLNGHTIDADGRSGVVRLAGGGALTLANGAEDVGALAGGRGSDGGGVLVEDGGAFTMAGGDVAGNSSDRGGGVYVRAGGAFAMDGGVVSYNFSRSGGGGVHVETGAAFSVSGSPVVSENADFDGEPSNVILETDATIAVNGLAAGASFGVTTDTTPLIGAPVVVVTNAAPGDEARFTSDNPACYVRFDGGSLWLAVAQYCRVDWSGSENVVVTTNGAEAVGGTDYREGTVLAFRPFPGMVVTNVDGAAVYLEGWDYVVEPVDSTNLVVLAGAETRARPAWAAAADDFSFWRWVETERVADYATEDYTAQYLLNVAPGATPWSLRIGGIEPVDGGAQIEVLATAGRGVVDLAAINGVLYVDVGDAATNLVPKAVPSANVRHDAETRVATVFVPESDGAFARARVSFPGFSNGSYLIPQAIAGLEIRPEAGTQVPVGETIRLRAVGILADGTEVDVSPVAAWTSADPEKATVARGVVRGVVEDDDAVAVTARAFGFEASVDVKVGYNYIILNSVREDVPDLETYLGYTVEREGEDGHEICRLYKDGVEVTDLVLPATFVHGNVSYCISGFDQEAFLRCVNLRSVILPDTASYVGVSAFAGCTSLQSVSMAPIVNYIGEYAFQDCAALEQLTLPDEITYLLESTFENCSSLTNIVVPALVGWIDKKAFAGCGSLRTVTLPASLESIGEEAFRDCGLQGAIDLPSCVESLGRGAFKGCAGLEAVAVPARITGLPDELFSGCENLQTVAMFTGSAADPPVLASIGQSAFEGCGNLASVSIPGLTVGGTYRGVTDIGDKAFKGCSSIGELTVPDGVERIGDEAFAEVQHIYYHGSADGAPWGANGMN